MYVSFFFLYLLAHRHIMQNVPKCPSNVTLVARKKYPETRYFSIKLCESNWLYKNIICVEYCEIYMYL